MKTIFYRCLPLVLGIALLSSCTPEPTPPTRLTIHLADSTLAPLVLLPASQQINHRSFMEAIDTVELQSDSTYSFAWQADTAAFYRIFSGQGNPIMHPFYLEPGDSLVVTQNPTEEGEPGYTGAQADFYPFFATHDRIAWEDSLMRVRYQDRFRMEPDSFRSFMIDRRDQLLSVYQEYAADSVASPLLDYAFGSIEYPYVAQHYDYLEYHNYYANDTFLYLYPDSSYFAFEEDVQPPSPATVHVANDYLSVMGGRIQKAYQDEIRDLPDSLQWERTFPGKWKIIRDELQGLDRDFGLIALAQDFTFYLDRDDFYPVLDSMREFSKSNYTSPGLHRKFMYRVDKINSIAPGQPAPPLILPDVEGNSVSLSDFEGKVVYLDFWGTWCFPCLQEMPHSLELEEKFGEEEVVFVYVALEYDEEDIARWRDFVTGERALDYAPFLEQRAYPGVHLVAEQQFNNPKIRPYLVNYAPTYVLIDQDGKIAQPRAPRPSSGEEIEEMLKNLLE